ncbi:MAG: sodium:proton antiporter NhaD [Bacteroidales bacterium]|nr:sodium:proton antiporter NhaD [Bacteroidales bacterium]
MFIFMIIAFIIGYVIIALEHPLKINKTATALLLGVFLWTCAIIGGSDILVNSEAFRDYTMNHPGSNFTDWLVHSQLLHALGEIAEILFFLMGAMTIVELVDNQGGFKIITDRIKTTKKVKLLWILSILTFFMSAVLDNLTTSIVMVALLRKLIGDKKDRWFYASMVIVAANSGGAWSPIGDVTTIMLWIAGKVSSLNIIEMTFLSSAVSLIVPLIILSFILKGEIERPENEEVQLEASFETAPWQSTLFLIIGVGALVCVPVFKTLTHLPPYIGMLGGLSILWILSEIVHRHDEEDVKAKYAISSVISRIDMPSILFFLGILLAVNALQSIGHLSLLANQLDTIPLQEPGKYYTISAIIGVLSSIVDNVPLVAATMGMYTFPMDHYFWEFMAYCAGTGGSLLIIGSAAGVAVMGMEKIDFIWYLKHISWIALVGYLAGCGTFICEKSIRSYFSDESQNQATVEMTEEGIAQYLENNTFYITQSSLEDGLMDSIRMNFIQYADNDMYGIHAKSYVTDLKKDTIYYFQQQSMLSKSTLEFHIEDTVGYVIYGDQQLGITQSGKLYLISQNGPVELIKE